MLNSVPRQGAPNLTVKSVTAQCLTRYFSVTFCKKPSTTVPLTAVLQKVEQIWFRGTELINVVNHVILAIKTTKQ
jgi:hypothetical protein